MLVFAEMVLQYLLTDQRCGYFPSVSAAWRISEEDFLKNVSFINDLKLRYSWGKMGSTSNVDPTNPYNLYATRLGKSAYDIAGNSTSPYVGFLQKQYRQRRQLRGKVILFQT